MKTRTLMDAEVTPTTSLFHVCQPPAAVYKPASKWTVVAAFTVAVALHVAAVLWVERDSEEPPANVVAASEHSSE